MSKEARTSLIVNAVCTPLLIAMLYAVTVITTEFDVHTIFKLSALLICYGITIFAMFVMWIRFHSELKRNR